MSDLDVGGLRILIDEAITKWASGEAPTGPSPSNEITEVKDTRVLPEGKRVVRTKSSGDRVYLVDEVKKTRQWITNGDVLTALGFEMGDVVELGDDELMKYNMASAIYKAPEPPDANA